MNLRNTKITKKTIHLDAIAGCHIFHCLTEAKNLAILKESEVILIHNEIEYVFDKKGNLIEE